MVPPWTHGQWGMALQPQDAGAKRAEETSSGDAPAQSRMPREGGSSSPLVCHCADIIPELQRLTEWCVLVSNAIFSSERNTLQHHFLLLQADEPSGHEMMIRAVICYSFL